MKFVLASSNQHKADEIAAMLPPGIELVLQSSLGVDSPPEPGATFVENALIKARHASRETGLPAIADDSGICVEALAGAPGVHSARYAGAGASDAENTGKLLSELGSTPERDAAFYCVLVCLAHPEDPAPLVATGRWPGQIAASPSGAGGFGYDPVFYLPELGRTAAELSADQKNAISHRGQALKKLVEQLNERHSA